MLIKNKLYEMYGFITSLITNNFEQTLSLYYILLFVMPTHFFAFSYFSGKR